MEEWIKRVKNRWNATADSEWYQSLRTDEKIESVEKNPASAFHPAVFELIQKYIPDMKDKRILLPSSGDNHAAFAFARMGASVTSADISERQLEHAAAIAEHRNLQIEFVCENTMELSQLESNAYDLVYTSNGTHSWIPDINSMYQNINRVLKTSGYSIMYDVHPFQRPFTGEPWEEPKIIKAYSDTMPDCHWRIQDLLNAMICSGMTVKEIAELEAVDDSFWYKYEELIKQDQKKLEKINDWRWNPMAALPAWIAIVAQK